MNKVTSETVIYQSDPEHPDRDYTDKIYTHRHPLPLGVYWCFGPEWCDLDHED